MFWVPPKSQILKEFCCQSLLVRPSVTRIALMVWVGRSARVKIAPVNLGLTNHILFLWMTRWKSYCKVCRQKGRNAGCREDGNNRMAFSMVWPSKHNLMTSEHLWCTEPIAAAWFLCSQTTTTLSGGVCHPLQLRKEEAHWDLGGSAHKYTQTHTSISWIVLELMPDVVSHNVYRN